VKALYVTNRAAAGDARLEEVLASLAGAPSLSVQLREKDTPDREVLALARRCRERLGAGVPFYINRRFDLAIAAGADGVQLPADGLPLSRVRGATPRGFRIGVSTHSASEAAAAIAGGADLVLIGPIFDTPSKHAFGPPLSPAVLAELAPAASHKSDVLAIGGIDEERLESLEPYRERIAGIAGIRLFQDAADPRAVAQRIAQR